MVVVVASAAKYQRTVNRGQLGEVHLMRCSTQLIWMLMHQHNRIGCLVDKQRKRISLHRPHPVHTTRHLKMSGKTFTPLGAMRMRRERGVLFDTRDFSVSPLSFHLSPTPSLTQYQNQEISTRHDSSAAEPYFTPATPTALSTASTEPCPDDLLLLRDIYNPLNTKECLRSTVQSP